MSVHVNSSCFMSIHVSCESKLIYVNPLLIHVNFKLHVNSLAVYIKVKLYADSCQLLMAQCEWIVSVWIHQQFMSQCTNQWDMWIYCQFVWIHCKLMLVGVSWCKSILVHVSLYQFMASCMSVHIKLYVDSCWFMSVHVNFKLYVNPCRNVNGLSVCVMQR
jgi:hypothetical protein